MIGAIQIIRDTLGVRGEGEMVRKSDTKCHIGKERGLKSDKKARIT